MYRTRTCGDLRLADEGLVVTLAGWVQKTRKMGGMTFVDIRDRYGITQLVFNQEVDAALCEKANKLGREFVIQVTGTVRERSSKNAHIPTGDIELIVSELNVLNTALTPPFTIEEETDGGDDLRMKYRYLDLRRACVRKNLELRHRMAFEVRRYLDEQGFLEVETPVLVNSTPEGARDFVVPSRMNPGQFYALPQSPQLYKQLLMIAGFDRYYQIARCFRDEDLRANRQPEFTQIDIEMSFVEEDEDVMAIAEGMIKEVFAKCKNITFTKPFRRMTWAEAMNRFGSDKPDTRFGLELHDISSAVKNTEFSVFRQALETGSVRAICVRGGADKFTRKEIDGFSDFVKDYGAKGLAWASKKEDGSTTSSFYKFLTEKEIADIEEILSADKGDLILAVADKKNKVVFDSLGALRVHIADKLNLYDKNEYDILWVTEFPLLEWSDEDNRFYAMHHPFTSVNVKDLDKIDSKDRDVLASIRANAYDLVINGQEAGGGSIRIHTPEMQRKMFEILGMSEETIKNRFGFFVDAFKYGAPPHGGLAFGLDRLVMLITGDDNIKDVIAFPKVQNASCLMTGAPDFVEDIQLKELGLDVPEEDK